MISLINLLKENSESIYEFGCVMLWVKFPKMEKLHSIISKSDIYTEEGDIKYGLEDEPHITLLYGLSKDVTLDQVKDKLKDFKFGPEKLVAYNASLFENKDKPYDVLKFDIKGQILSAINEQLKTLPFKSDFPNYHPHMTIGYIKKGEGQKYTNYLKGIKFELQPEYIVYSHNGIDDKIEIKFINGK